MSAAAQAALPAIDKNRPSPEWIQSLRARYPVERQIDALLTRKMNLRSGPGYSPVALDTLVAGVGALIHAELGHQHFTLSEARWLSGGASKLQMAFTLDWERPGVGRERTPMVLRMEPAESIVATSRLREFQLIKAMNGVVPVPPVYWCDDLGEHLPYPALIYGFAQGVAKPSAAVSGVSGVGTKLPPELRRALGPQFTHHLAKIHGRDVGSADLSAFDVPAAGTQCAEWGMNWWDRVWEEDGDEAIPLLGVLSAWLRRNMPRLDAPVIVHSDYRVGNFLFTEHDHQISAWLDWELGRIGDRHQDLAWTTNRAFMDIDADGKTPLVCGLMPESQFFEAYEEASGVRVDPKTLHWYKLYNLYSLAVLLIGTGHRIARLGKTHQDVLVAWLVGIGGVQLNEAVDLLEQGA